MTLYEFRVQQLLDQVDDLLESADMLRRCREDGTPNSSFTNLVRRVESLARDARHTAAKVDDLRDVQNHGVSGGRSYVG